MDNEQNAAATTESAYNTKSVEQNEELQTGILNDLHMLQKKTLMYQRITAGLVLIFVIAILCVVPSLLSTLKAARETLAGVDAAIVNANEAIDQAQDSLTEMSAFVETAGEDLTNVVNSFESIDFDSLNNAIKNLDATVEPLANFFGKFGR